MKAKKFTEDEINLVQCIIDEHLPLCNDNAVRLAEMWGINNTHIYLAIGGKVTPTLWNTLIKKNLIDGPETRIRISSDCTENERSTLHKFSANKLGIPYAEFIRQLANDAGLQDLIAQYYMEKK